MLTNFAEAYGLKSDTNLIYVPNNNYNIKQNNTIGHDMRGQNNFLFVGYWNVIKYVCFLKYGEIMRITRKKMLHNKQYKNSGRFSDYLIPNIIWKITLIKYNT